MHRIYQHMLEDILPAIDAGDAELLALIAQCDEGLQIKDQRLTFTLPALFSFTVAQHNRRCTGSQQVLDCRENYNQFRELLFERPPNDTLKAFGLQVALELADLDPDRVIYTLTKQGDAP